MFEQSNRRQQRLHALPIAVDQLRQFLTLRGTQVTAKITLYVHQHVGVVAARRLMRQQSHQTAAVLNGERLQRLPFIHISHKAPQFAVFRL
ncbi:hypothetical protein D3C80_1533040 [compost metagenome]